MCHLLTEDLRNRLWVGKEARGERNWTKNFLLEKPQLIPHRACRRVFFPWFPFGWGVGLFTLQRGVVVSSYWWKRSRVMSPLLRRLHLAKGSPWGSGVQGHISGPVAESPLHLVLEGSWVRHTAPRHGTTVVTNHPSKASTSGLRNPDRTLSLDKGERRFLFSLSSKNRIVRSLPTGLWKQILSHRATAGCQWAPTAGWPD